MHLSSENKRIAMDSIKALSDITTSPETRGHLTTVAENSCCAQFHRNKLYGSGLTSKLATKWYNERCLAAGIKIVDEIEITAAPVPVEFAKHHVFEGDTLLSKLREDIDPKASKLGLIYIYTHNISPFYGMIKIGYTSKQVATSRLDHWATCGHGVATLLETIEQVRHPERVESLIHFGLLENWYELRWCNVHARSHIEWFKAKSSETAETARLWCDWMNRANPYDRHGELKKVWREHLEFLKKFEITISAEMMVLVQNIEEGSEDISELIKDGYPVPRRSMIRE